MIGIVRIVIVNRNQYEIKVVQYCDNSLPTYYIIQDAVAWSHPKARRARRLYLAGVWRSGLITRGQWLQLLERWEGLTYATTPEDTAAFDRLEEEEDERILHNSLAGVYEVFHDFEGNPYESWYPIKVPIVFPT